METNLTVEINFANDKVDDIVEAITALLIKYGYREHHRETGPLDQNYIKDMVVFYPEES